MFSRGAKHSSAIVLGETRSQSRETSSSTELRRERNRHRSPLAAEGVAAARFRLLRPLSIVPSGQKVESGVILELVSPYDIGRVTGGQPKPNMLRFTGPPALRVSCMLRGNLRLNGEVG